jgi:hypothetical protein
MRNSFGKYVILLKYARRREMPWEMQAWAGDNIKLDLREIR